MFYDNINECFIKYLESKGIKYVEGFKDSDKYQNVTISMIREQINNINEFHIRTQGYTGHMNKRLDNNIGKTVEQYKIYIKKLDKQLKFIKQKDNNNEFEKLLLDYGEEYLNRARRCIDVIYKSDYIGLIRRSMKRVEMCLGNTYINNLRKTNILEVADISSCCYNMVEMDIAYFLGKIKRKRMEINFCELTSEFCEMQNLEDDSSKFILSIISYPSEFIKYCNRYREKSKNWTEDEYVSKLKKAMIADGKSLI